MQKRRASIDFSLSEEQRAIRQAAQDFARSEIDPLVEEIDETQTFPRELFAKIGELGFLGIIFPEELGGSGLGYVDYVLILNEISKVDPSIGLSVAAHNSLCSNHIFKFGDDEQHQRWLVPLAKGEKIGAWGLTEPDAGSDAAGTRTRAEKVEGGWMLNGSKTFITHGSVGDICVVLAVTSTEGRRYDSIGAFRGREGDGGFQLGQEGEQARQPSLGYLGSPVEQLLRPRRPSAGKPGRGVQTGAADSRWRTHLDCRSGVGYSSRGL